MNIYDEITGEILTNPDLTKGYLYPQKRFVRHHDEVPENYTLKVMPDTEELNDGQGLQGKVILTPYQAAYDEYEDCLIYHAFTVEEKPTEPAKGMSDYPTWSDLAEQYKKGVSSV